MYYCCVCPKCSKHVTLQSHESALGCILRAFPMATGPGAGPGSSVGDCF
jgi:hypothetical protein